MPSQQHDCLSIDRSKVAAGRHENPGTPDETGNKEKGHTALESPSVTGMPIEVGIEKVAGDLAATVSMTGTELALC